MKFLALMKDSLREAVDSKVLYVTVGLSSLLILAVASVSFRPLTAKEEIQDNSYLTWWDKALVQAFSQERPDAFALEITDFRQTNDAADPWKGDYRFDVLLTFESPEKAKEFARKPKLPEGRLLDVIEKDYFWLKDTDAELVPPDADHPLEVRYHVKSAGTKIDNALDWRYAPTVAFAVPLPAAFHCSVHGAAYWIEDYMINGFGSWIGILVGVVLTAFFVPNMLQKGTVDMLVVKPIHRATLLIYKYLGGLWFVLLNTGFAVGGVWLVLGLRTGIWAPGFLVSILGITFYFAILYGVSVLMAVLTRSPIVSIVVTVAVWAFLWGNGFAYSFLTAVRKEPEARAQVAGIPDWLYTAGDVMHYVLPRTKDLDILLTKTIGKGLLTEAEYKSNGYDKLPDIHWGESLTVSGAFIAVVLGLACWRFAVKDY
jgi:ABC-type transport system involved in multi-copper enzyme maturation permease subunit